ncbi:MAG: hypothetical protein M1835_002752 [Candelina submexicana]|nr:MAG: hypothetical protein M1835_002752 [Candelina submexicana]
MENESGLLAIVVYSSDEESAGVLLARDVQSEADFLKQKTSWKPKVETGEIWKTLEYLPSKIRFKPEGQTLLHAIEELFYNRKYTEAVKLADKALSCTLDGDLRKHILTYKDRCTAHRIQMERPR